MESATIPPDGFPLLDAGNDNLKAWLVKINVPLHIYDSLVSLGANTVRSENKWG